MTRRAMSNERIKMFFAVFIILNLSIYNFFTFSYAKTLAKVVPMCSVAYSNLFDIHFSISRVQLFLLILFLYSFITYVYKNRLILYLLTTYKLIFSGDKYFL